MKIRSYRILFGIFSYLADKTNGASFFVKYKLLLGTLIIGLAGTSCGKSKMQQPTCYDISPPEPEIPQIMCYEPVAPPLPEEDTIKVIHPVAPKDIVTEEIPIVSCYVPVLPVETEEPTEPDFMLYGMIDTPPVSPEGELSKFVEWVQQNLQYPDSMIKNEIQGRVVVNFIIDTDGKLTELKLLRSVDPEIDEEALRVISTSKPWTPGKDKDKLVRTSVTIPVTFRLPQD